MAEVDLFGNEVCLTPRGRGRPPFERTQENANSVSMLLAMGWTNERIASAIVDPRTGKSISVPTLKRYFRAELKVRDAARDRMRLRQFMRLWQAAEAGNLGAERQFERMVEANDRLLAEARLGDRKPADAAPPRGVKELSADQAAEAEQQLQAEAARGRPN